MSFLNRFAHGGKCLELSLGGEEWQGFGFVWASKWKGIFGGE